MEKKADELRIVSKVTSFHLFWIYDRLVDEMSPPFYWRSQLNNYFLVTLSELLIISCDPTLPTHRIITICIKHHNPLPLIQAFLGVFTGQKLYQISDHPSYLLVMFCKSIIFSWEKEKKKLHRASEVYSLVQESKCDVVSGAFYPICSNSGCVTSLSSTEQGVFTVSPARNLFPPWLW